MTKKNIFTRTMAALFMVIIVAGGAIPASAQPPSPTSPVPNPPSPGNHLYLPVLLNQKSDAYVSDLEVTQAIQNIANPVKLVANRPTAVRVYARVAGAQPATNVSASLTAYRGSVVLGQLILNGGTASPASASLETLRADATKSFNFNLPAGWISAGSLTLVAQAGVSGLNGPTTSAASYSLQLTFNTVPQLNVVAVPIVLNDEYGPADTSYLHAALFRMYPVPSVNVSIHSPIHFYGDLSGSSDWGTLLDLITSIRDGEVGTSSSVVYYGVIPLADSTGYTWFPTSGGIVGYGWVGDRVSIGVSDESFHLSGYTGTYYLYGNDTAAHEIGHNLNRVHTYGCGADNYDLSYPYANGIIGQYGFKFDLTPDDLSPIVPNTFNDIMNYCTDQWVSDYTYSGLYADQVQSAFRVSLPVQQSLLVRASLDENGAFAFQPVYSFAASPSQPPQVSDYSVQFLDESGQVIAETPVQVFAAEERGYATQAIHAALPDPGRPIRQIRLMHNGQPAAARPLSAPLASAMAAAPTLTQDGNRATLDWGASRTPAMVRLTADGGATWTTLGVDVTGGKLSLALDDLPSGALQFQILLDGGGALHLDFHK